MYSLCLHTADMASQVGVFRGDQRLAVIALAADERQSATLLPGVQACLAQADVTLDQIEVMAVNIGPGSFTGVRVGLSAAHGLALVKHIPVVGVDGFDLAAHGMQEATILIRSRKDEVYCQPYKAGRKKGDPVACKIKDLPGGSYFSYESDLPGEAPVLGVLESLNHHARQADLDNAPFPRPVYLRPADVSTPKDVA